MSPAGYSIFNHAQFGNNCRNDGTQSNVINATDEVTAASPDESSSSKLMKRRARRERGWSVELGLGLGPAFNRTRKTNE